MAFIPTYLLILFFVIVVDYIAALIMEKLDGGKRKLVLLISIFANLSLLAAFKYFDFFIENAHFFLHAIGLDITIPNLGLILPIGLSFHTFQAMSYTIEVYRRNQAPERNILIYSLYVLFFPQLVAGPIERPQNLLPQLKIGHKFNFERATSGLQLMLIGFLKKVLIADRLAVLVDQIYSDPTNYGGPALLLAIYFFSLQIYCDFSGYSDIAIGAARVLGIDLMRNFKRPYFSGSIIEFWRNWHISLSTWFRDYVYVPLGGNKVSSIRWSINIFIVFLLSGLWHGANWTFIAWGTLHGFFIIISQAFKRIINHNPVQTLNGNKAISFFKILFTFNLVTFLWVFFRAESFADVYYIFTHIFDMSRGFQPKELGLNIFEILVAIFSITALLAYESLGDQDEIDSRLRKLGLGGKIALWYFAVGVLLLFGKFSRQQFVYFQF